MAKVAGGTYLNELLPMFPAHGNCKMLHCQGVTGAIIPETLLMQQSPMLVSDLIRVDSLTV